MNEQSPPPPENPKRRGRGCLTAILVLGGLTFLAGATIGIIAWRFARSPQGQKILAPSKVLLRAKDAPGAKELGALGCAAAGILDLNESAEAWSFAFGRDAGLQYQTDARFLVTCQAPFLRTPPSCAQIAATYVRAVGGRALGKFDVVASTPGDVKPRCRVQYDEGGAER
jgi:hypothetical protein